MNNSLGIQDKSYAIIVEAIAKIEQIEQASVFGSRSLGNYKKGSDIDIVLYGPEIQDNTVRKLKSYINHDTIVPYYIDIVVYHQLKNKRLKDHIDKNAKVLFSRNPK